MTRLGKLSTTGTRAAYRSWKRVEANERSSQVGDQRSIGSWESGWHSWCWAAEIRVEKRSLGTPKSPSLFPRPTCGLAFLLLARAVLCDDLIEF